MKSKVSLRWQLYCDSCRPPLGLRPGPPLHPHPPPPRAVGEVGEEARLAAALSCHSTSVVVVPSPGNRARRQQMMYLTEHRGREAWLQTARWRGSTKVLLARGLGGLLWCRTVKLLNLGNQIVFSQNFGRIKQNCLFGGRQIWNKGSCGVEVDFIKKSSVQYKMACILLWTRTKLTDGVSHVYQMSVRNEAVGLCPCVSIPP